MDFLIAPLLAGVTVVTDANSLNESLALVAARRSLKPKPTDGAVSGIITPSPSVFGGLLCRRRSQRDFSNEAPTQEMLERLLVDCAGGVQLTYSEDGSRLDLLDRTIPQAGGIVSIGVDLVLLCSVGNLSAGIYRLCPCTNSLHLVETGVVLDTIKQTLNWQGASDLNGAAALLVITGNFETKAYKYGDRGCRFVYLEAGCAMQNALLSISDQGMAAYPYGGFDDQRLSTLLHLMPESEMALGLIIIGMPPVGEADL